MIIANFIQKITTIILVVVGVIIMTGCGENTSTEPKPKTQVTKPTTQVSKPKPKVSVKSCFESAGLNNSEQMDSNFWRASFDNGLIIRVTRFNTSKEAKQASKEATEIISDYSGLYFVAGPVTSAADDEVSETITTMTNCLGQVN